MARSLVFCLGLGYTEREFWHMTPRKVTALVEAYKYLNTPDEPKQSILDVLPI